MKKFMFAAMAALVLVSCGTAEKKDSKDSKDSNVATKSTEVTKEAKEKMDKPATDDVKLNVSTNPECATAIN